MKYVGVSSSKFRDQVEEAYKPCWPKYPWYLQLWFIVTGQKDDIQRQDRLNAKNRKNNAYGFVLTEDGLPVICMHGGSSWLCVECAEKILVEKR